MIKSDNMAEGWIFRAADYFVHVACALLAAIVAHGFNLF
jgi:hypothetical protein